MAPSRRRLQGRMLWKALLRSQNAPHELLAFAENRGSKSRRSEHGMPRFLTEGARLREMDGCAGTPVSEAGALHSCAELTNICYDLWTGFVVLRRLIRAVASSL